MEKNVKTLREELALTQAQLADRLGVTESTVRNWESGRSKPPQSALHLLHQLTAPSISQSNNKGTTIGTQTSDTGALRLLQAQLKEKDGQIEKLHTMIAELIKVLATK